MSDSDIKFQRTTDAELTWDVEYNLKGEGRLYKRITDSDKSDTHYFKASVNLASEGIFRIPEMRGATTKSSASLTASWYYGLKLWRTHRKAYYAKFSTDFHYETRKDSLTNETVTTNRTYGFTLDTSIPFFDYPGYLVQEYWKSNRGGTPLYVTLEYLGPGLDDENEGTLARLDGTAKYEISFHPLCILRGTWCWSRIFDAPENMQSDNWHYTYEYAMKLEELMKSIGSGIPFLSDYLTKQKEAGNNYVYYQLAFGRKAPDFERRSESSIGFSFGF